MKVHYYPGCSRKARRWNTIGPPGRCSALGVELAEIEDWTCCGLPRPRPPAA
jgi:heterodisulfide reductase subunit B